MSTQYSSHTDAAVLGIVLARAGSRGVPGKNTMPIADRPCVTWTLDAGNAAMEAGALADYVVSSDCSQVAIEAGRAGVAHIRRPAELASDNARIDDALRHALLEYESHAQTKFAAIVALYANVPVRPTGLIASAVELWRSTGCDSVQSYAEVGKHHPWWTARVDDTGRVDAFDGGVLNHGVYRRQELPPAHVPDGGVLLISRAALLGEINGVATGPHTFFGRDRRGIVTKPGEVVDIDSEIDAVVAEAVLVGQQHNPNHSSFNQRDDERRVA